MRGQRAQRLTRVYKIDRGDHTEPDFQRKVGL
jgi:hypothetical protein